MYVDLTPEQVQMITQLIDAAEERGFSEISHDAADDFGEFTLAESRDEVLEAVAAVEECTLQFQDPLVEENRFRVLLIPSNDHDMLSDFSAPAALFSEIDAIVNQILDESI